MLNSLNQLRMINAFRKLVKNPARTEEVFTLARLGLRNKDQRAVQEIIDYASKHREFVELFEKQYLPALPTMETLAKFLPGTLGAEYHQHLERNGLRPDFFPAEKTDDLLGYLIMRSRQTHDLWHVLTGYNTTLEHELALQGFTLAQTHATISAALISGGLLHLGKFNPQGLGNAMDLILEGYLRGKKANYLLSIKWEMCLHLKLSEAREMAGTVVMALSQPKDIGTPHAILGA